MLLFSSTCLTIAGFAWLMDRWLGEPQRLHPLVGFGNLASRLENEVRHRFPMSPTSALYGRVLGVIAVGVLLVPPVALAMELAAIPAWGPLFQILMLYLALGGKSLEEHALRVHQALEDDNLELSRSRVSHMVSRDTQHMHPPEVARATVESILENGCDAIFSTLFWFALLGGPGAILFRISNTLDAMWGYRNDRYRYFGWGAARLDDILGYLPARLTALTYMACGHSRKALAAWNRCTERKSPNATLVMAVGGGALDLRLGGGGHYHGHWQTAPILGGANPPATQDIQQATRLVSRATLVWVIAYCLFGIGTTITGLYP
ncbi:MAG: cobalamin biosynthesis protein CobD [Nitrospirae bacterium]|nr:cobalamin biosynthesis protein CobD [Magnetococcales bacterium]